MTTSLDPIHSDPRGTAVPVENATPVNNHEFRADYEARRKIFPSRVLGFYRNLKWVLVAVMLGIYWLLPWIRWDRGPNAPDQAVLLDLTHRRFYFFAIEIWPQEFYYVAGLLIMAGLGLFLVTSVAGRAWCGYACPQTVWTDLFIQVERWVEGDRNARMKLDAAPWTLTKWRKRLTVWASWIIISVATGGAWVFYFADAPTLARDIVMLQASPTSYFTILTLAATTFWLAGFMREQVCTYMCPWPRIQGAMLDENSLIVTYNDWRGEPRSRHTKKASAQGLDVGDCVDCNACVAACPMGIDIRDGQQLECITCALCIDACDTVMDKVGRPLGLISYSTLVDFEHHTQTAKTQGREAATTEQKRVSMARMATPRTILYFTLWAAIGLGMLFVLFTRGHLDVTVLHDRAPLFTTLSDGSIRNGYTLKVASKTLEERPLELHLEGLEDAVMWTTESETRGRALSVIVPPDAVRDLRVFVSRPRGATQDTFTFVVTDPESGETVAAKAQFEAGARR